MLDDWDVQRPTPFTVQHRPYKGLLLKNLGNQTLTRHLHYLDQEVRHLRRKLKRTIRIVELGSWAGESAMALAYENDALIICVDTWFGSPTPGSPDTGFLSQLEHGPTQIFTLFLENTRPILRQRSVLKMDTVKAADFYTETYKHKIDLLFVDADHSYEGTKADILAWLPNMSANYCTILGHDYKSAQFPGVERAVHELFPDGAITEHAPAGRTGSIWRVRMNNCKPIVPSGHAADPSNHFRDYRPRKEPKSD